MKARFLFLMIIFFVSGCCFGNRRPLLTYSPVLAPQPKNSIALKITAFEDKRTIKDIVGSLRDVTSGFRFGKVIPQNSVTEWITDALKAELTNAGYSISDQENTPNVIEGEVFGVFCDAAFTYDGSIGIKVTLKRNDKVVLEKQYSAKKSRIGNYAMTGRAFAKTLEMTLQETLKQAVSDINKELLK